MNLKGKFDLEKTLERFEAWWLCELIDRPVVTMNLRQATNPMPSSHHACDRDRWLDIDYSLAVLDARFTEKDFLADTLPVAMPTLGPEVCAALYGAELEFAATTTYAKPIASNCGDLLSLEPDFNNFYWRHLRRQTESMIEHGQGKWITGLPDLHFSGDLLAALRDPQDLLLEMAEDLNTVVDAIQHFEAHVPAIYDDMHQLIERAGLPTLTWMPCAHWGRALVSQCDLICMISPKMFQKTILPALTNEITQMERTIFHLDGPQALIHLDALLDIKELNGIQWVYGAGNGPAAKWIEVYKRIQAAGKCVQLNCVSIPDALALMEHLQPEGCWFSMAGAYSRQEIETFLKTVEDWTAKARRIYSR